VSTKVKVETLSERIGRALSLLASAESSGDEVVRELVGFTPGPWTYAHDGHGGISVDDSTGRQIAFVRRATEANARLIAAAPTMLAHILALKAELASVKAHAEAMATKHEEIRTASVREIDRMEAQLHEAVDAYRRDFPKDAP